MHSVKKPEPKFLQRKRANASQMKKQELEGAIWYDCSPIDLMARIIFDPKSKRLDALNRRILAAQRICDLSEALTPFGIRHIAIGGPAIAEPQKGDRVARVVVWIDDCVSIRINHNAKRELNSGGVQLDRTNEARRFDKFQLLNASHLSITLLEGRKTPYHLERTALDFCGDAELEHRRSSLLFCETVSSHLLLSSFATLCKS